MKKSFLLIVAVLFFAPLTKATTLYVGNKTNETIQVEVLGTIRSNIQVYSPRKTISPGTWTTFINIGDITGPLKVSFPGQEKIKFITYETNGREHSEQKRKFKKNIASFIKQEKKRISTLKKTGKKFTDTNIKKVARETKQMITNIGKMTQKEALKLKKWEKTHLNYIFPLRIAGIKNVDISFDPSRTYKVGGETYRWPVIQEIWPAKRPWALMKMIVEK